MTVVDFFFDFVFDDFEFFDFSDDRCTKSSFGKKTGFIFFEFSEKVSWARCFGKAFWAVLGVSVGVRGASWERLGRSWGNLGASGGVREASWEALGRSCGDLGATFCAFRFRIHFLIDFDAKRVPKGRHLGSQNGAKIDPQTNQNLSKC